MTRHTLQAIAILAPAIVTAWICRPRRRRPAIARTLAFELASIQRRYDCRANLIHLGRPEILAILNAPLGDRERREIPDLAARALRLEHCLDDRRDVRAPAAIAKDSDLSGSMPVPLRRSARRRRRSRRPADRNRFREIVARALARALRLERSRRSGRPADRNRFREFFARALRAFDRAVSRMGLRQWH